MYYNLLIAIYLLVLNKESELTRVTGILWEICI